MAGKKKPCISTSHAEALTDNEGSLIGLVRRQQPVTAYQLYKIYELSPVSSFNTSKGSLYPLINRLKNRGLLASQSVTGDKRNTEQLTCTEAGIAAVAAWAKTVQPSDILLDDPLRTKLLSLDLLSKEDQTRWVVEAKTEVSKKMKTVKAYNLSVSVPFQQFVYNSALLALDAKMKWLDDLLYHIVKDGN
jgi:DNA-binding PadR family transcriptional regulator